MGSNVANWQYVVIHTDKGYGIYEAIVTKEGRLENVPNQSVSDAYFRDMDGLAVMLGDMLKSLTGTIYREDDIV
jgi:hypothetical protein